MSELRGAVPYYTNPQDAVTAHILYAGFTERLAQEQPPLDVLNSWFDKALESMSNTNVFIGVSPDGQETWVDAMTLAEDLGKLVETNAKIAERFATAGPQLHALGIDSPQRYLAAQLWYEHAQDNQPNIDRLNAIFELTSEESTMNNEVYGFMGFMNARMDQAPQEFTTETEQFVWALSTPLNFQDTTLASWEMDPTRGLTSMSAFDRLNEYMHLFYDDEQGTVIQGIAYESGVMTDMGAINGRRSALIQTLQAREDRLGEMGAIIMTNPRYKGLIDAVLHDFHLAHTDDPDVMVSAEMIFGEDGLMPEPILSPIDYQTINNEIQAFLSGTKNTIDVTLEDTGFDMISIENFRTVLSPFPIERPDYPAYSACCVPVEIPRLRARTDTGQQYVEGQSAGYDTGINLPTHSEPISKFDSIGAMFLAAVIAGIVGWIKLNSRFRQSSVNTKR